MLRNESGLKFVDISSEEWREYDFGDGHLVRIVEPLFLHVSGNGHRLLDAQGLCHYIPIHWLHLTWQVKEGKPHFVL